MRPMLDDLELPNVQEIATYDRRMLAEHKPPGMKGSVLQNMGRRPTRLLLWGIATGSDVTAFVEDLDSKFRTNDAYPFVADIIADAEIAQMIIDDLKWQEVAGKPERVAYVMVLREYIEPVEPEDTAFLDTGILEDAQGLMDDLVTALDLALPFATGLERFVGPMTDFVTRLQEMNDE